MSDDPISQLGSLAKPATVLIEKVSDAVGGVFKPYQIVRVAKAEAAADQIRAASEIQVADLHRRAMNRFLEEEAQRQLNIEAITQKALPLLKEEATPEGVERDWITNFFDKSRLISDEDMQKLWSQVLAGEANSPGTFSRRTINLMSDLDKDDAEIFVNVCNLCWTIEGYFVPLVFDVQNEIYGINGVNFSTLSHLDSLGLVQFDNVAGFKRLRLPKELTTNYFGRKVRLSFPNDAENTLSVGKVLLTRAGRELASVCGATPIDEFFSFIQDQWAKQSLLATDKAEPIIPPDAAR